MNDSRISRSLERAGLRSSSFFAKTTTGYARCVPAALLLSLSICVGHGAAQPSADESGAEDKDAGALHVAVRELSYFNFDRSYELFAALRARAQPKQGDLWQEATLGLALSAHSCTPSSAELMAEAGALYRELADPRLHSRFAPRALLQLGRIAEVRDYGGDEVDLPSAIGFYESVYEKWPELHIADEAVMRHGMALTQQFDQPQAIQAGIDLMQSWVGAHEDRPLASSIYEAIGWSRLKFQDDAAGAVAAFLKADSLGLVDSSVAGQLYFRIAALADQRTGDLKTAARYYQKVIRETPRSGRAFEAQLALRRLAEAHPDAAIVVPEISLLGGDADAAEAELNPTSPPQSQPEAQP